MNDPNVPEVPEVSPIPAISSVVIGIPRRIIFIPGIKRVLDEYRVRYKYRDTKPVLLGHLETLANSLERSEYEWLGRWFRHEFDINQQRRQANASYRAEQENAVREGPDSGDNTIVEKGPSWAPDKERPSDHVSESLPIRAPADYKREALSRYQKERRKLRRQQARVASRSREESKSTQRNRQAVSAFVEQFRRINDAQGEEDYSSKRYGLDRELALKEDIKLLKCRICLDFHPTGAMPSLNRACRHDSESCLDCLAAYLSVEIDSKTADAITCPFCPELISFEMVKRYAAAENFERYERKQVLGVLSSMPGFTSCLRPGCGSGQIHLDGNEQPIVTCDACGFKTCFTHQLPWHQDETCAEYDASNALRSEQEQSSQSYLSEFSKTCPNENCKARVEKYGGCDHMTCKKCKYEYCWICLADYKKIRKHGNARHSSDCRYHHDNL